MSSVEIKLKHFGPFLFVYLTMYFLLVHKGHLKLALVNTSTSRKKPILGVTRYISGVALGEGIGFKNSYIR